MVTALETRNNISTRAQKLCDLLRGLDSRYTSAKELYFACLLETATFLFHHNSVSAFSLKISSWLFFLPAATDEQVFC